MQELLKSLESKICDIAVGAGQIILEIYNSDMDFGVEAKSDNSPLTIADQKANEHIVTELLKLDSSFPIISEENKIVDFSERKNYEYCWLVDPLDGTKEFIKRNGEFTVNIALLHKGKAVLGVVYTPVTKELYYGAKDCGAFKRHNGKTLQMKAASFSKEDSGLRVVCSRSHLNPETQSFIDALNQPQLVAKGSSLKFMILAEGKAELYPRLAPTMEWDTGAAQIILEEAGGQVLHYDSLDPLCYNKENLLNPFFLARGNQN